MGDRHTRTVTQTHRHAQTRRCTSREYEWREGMRLKPPAEQCRWQEELSLW